MDYSAIIKALRVRVEAIDSAIANLESMMVPEPTPSSVKTPKRRGRKSMGEAERQQVSERMKRYWAKRQKRAK